MDDIKGVRVRKFSFKSDNLDKQYDWCCCTRD